MIGSIASFSGLASGVQWRDLVDEIIKEPAGGAHTDPTGAAAFLDVALEEHLGELVKQKPDKLLRSRAEKYYNMGVFAEG